MLVYKNGNKWKMYQYIMILSQYTVISEQTFAPYYQIYEKYEQMFACQLIHSPRRIDFPENHFCLFKQKHQRKIHRLK